MDREFGTGALKVTPAHDPNDYEIGKNHKLELISILDETARINENGGPYAGMDRFECRKKIWADMKAAGLVIKEKPYTINVPRSQRGGEIVEPMVSTQWFIASSLLLKQPWKPSAAAISNSFRSISPRCITTGWKTSRIGASAASFGGGTASRSGIARIAAKSPFRATDPTACTHCGSGRIAQDPDVLDTWFSSGLWPFSTLGWPEDTPDLRYFYPTSVMETGYDILFFWVARMIMIGLEFTGEAPFRQFICMGLSAMNTAKK